MPVPRFFLHAPGSRRPGARLTLRIRLVGALALLAGAGLGVFGVATYSLYARSLYTRVDEQAQASVLLVSRQLRQTAGLEPDTRVGGAGGGNAPPVIIPPGTYAELRDEAGTVRSEERRVGKGGKCGR